MRSRKSRLKVAASIVIHTPGKMNKRGRKDVAKWLRRHADMLVKHGEMYDPVVFRGRYYYTVSKRA